MPTPAAPQSQEERDLERLQASVTKGEAARDLRNEIAFGLWMGGMTQQEVAARLDRADRRAGGTGITHGTVQKMLFRMRKARETELVERASS